MILAKVTEECKSCKAVSQTAALWLQYFDIVRGFLKAERTGNYEMHIHAVSQMLPYFAALLIIEQVLMRSLKTTGGLTRSNGMTEQKRVTWLLSTPASAQASYAMQDLVGIQCEHSDQTKVMSETRQKRDVEVTVVILETIAGEGRNPFVQDSVLKNIMPGVNAEEYVDVDEARAKGEKIYASMAGQPVNTYSFKRKNKSIALAAGSSVKIDGVKVCVDPQLLFQRLVFSRNSLAELRVSSNTNFAVIPPHSLILLLHCVSPKRHLSVMLRGKSSPSKQRQDQLVKLSTLLMVEPYFIESRGQS